MGLIARRGPQEGQQWQGLLLTAEQHVGEKDRDLQLAKEAQALAVKRLTAQVCW